MVNGPLSRAEMIQHAQDWIAAWNRRDVAAVLSAFTPEARFRSPLARQVTGEGELKGREAIARYWTDALTRIGHLSFQLQDVICDEAGQTMVVLYEARLDGPPRRACEIFRFEDGMKMEGEALYGDTPPIPVTA
ncbi:nuclear transport factor 2 family protein [Aquabacter sp. L1I39]|uniref:nuclear transport factor 2 family protein n=1 Tax=Aquabacter sp. L1I39 TaxID=2820278 RepID=UPI001ADC4519|nr:nuclear transport factor 2 family protein [Aquabacter sp. L1I39]QTL01631.1 nuclear transport factor 2 family protein [Aquabacter sp. L1I39]